MAVTVNSDVRLSLYQGGKQLRLSGGKGKKMKYAQMTWGMMEAIVNKLGGETGAKRFLRGELVVSEPERRWREEDGVIYFTLPPTDGTTGEEWIERLESQNFRVSDWTKKVLRSPDFVPTKGVIHKVAVLKGDLFKDSARRMSNIRTEAKKRGFLTPNAEVACLIREHFRDFSNEEFKAMGLWVIITMHEPIVDPDGHPFLFHAGRSRDELSWLYTGYCPNGCWNRDGGFAFIVSETHV